MKRVLASLALGFLAIGAFAQWTPPGDDVPAYHAAAPAKGEKIPPVLAGSQLSGPNFQYPWQVRAYLDAAKIQPVLYQLPCYCHCDRALGHQSLHSCFEGLHGAECSTCSEEAIFAYQMVLKGKSAKEIREAVMRGEYKQVDLNSAAGF